uniref:Cytochrome P450 CYP4L30 n=1 Tax=Zygaena filipendulae TaxID=287375 RepID=A0A286MXM0_9NEOP|nr:cytochrome P450 CYP4L30 [Zygaena filipendulae]
MLAYLYVITFIIILMLLYSWLNFLYDARKINLPGPTPLPIVGNGHLLLGGAVKLLKTLEDLAEKYDDALCFYLLSHRYVQLTHPKYLESVMSSTELISKGRSYDMMYPWLGSSLLTSSGNRWKVFRKLMTPAFHFNILQTFLPVFCKNQTIMIQKFKALADGNTVNIFPIVALGALDNITESIMGVSVDAQKSSESSYVKAVEDISKIIAHRIQNIFTTNDVLFNLTPMKKKHDAALKILHKQVNEVIEARRRELDKTNVKNLTAPSDEVQKKHAFLDLLLLSRIDGEKISDEDVRNEVNTFMFEGHDTTAAAVSFCLYCLSNNDEAQENILNEIRNIMGDDAMNKDPTYSELQQMKYLEMVIKETLRLYPSAAVIERLVTRDTEICGIRLPKDTLIFINIIAMQRNPRVYDEPLKFIPERFENTQKNPFAWLAFSAGPRNCIGQKFAMLEMKIMISSIVKNFQILPSGIDPVLALDVILRSVNGINVKLIPRE